MKKKATQNQEFWMALGINLLFVIIYACLCHPTYEVSDDNAMALFVEGAYGSRTAHLIFENIIWGKFLTLLSMLAPGIKWYTVSLYAGMFCAYTGISYFMMKVGGKMAGFAGSVFLLVFLGMESYVTFQWTRAAAVITIGGMLVLFYAVEYAEGKWEKRIALFFGVTLCIVGSMIRFLFFAVCVVLVGGAILMKMGEIIKMREDGWKKRIRIYLCVYGAVGIASFALYGIDRACYLTDETWNYYSEYNSLRSELWDYGFPDYTQNQELYESLGISQSDIVMYRRWNMDEELLPIETLRALVDAKEKRSFSWQVVHEFVKVFFLSFLCKPLFGMLLIVFIIFIALNRKNLLLVSYILLGIIAFELYFYWTGRFGLDRIDTGMLAAGMTAVLCGRSEDLNRVRFQLRWMVVLACTPLLLSLPTFYTKISRGSTSLPEFTKMMSEDKDNLYLLSLSKSYNPCTSGSYFWEPVPYGGFSNIYAMGGWEFNVPVKKALLAKWGISNIYRDSIDALNVRLFSDEDAKIIERYIRENYNEDVSLCLLKNINSFKIWGVRTGGVKLEGNVNKDLLEIEHQINWEIKKKKISVSGYAYKKESNSFRQQAYLKLQDLKSGEITYKELTMSKLGDGTDMMNGAWSNITGDIHVEGEYDVSVVLEAEGELYEIPSGL